MLRCAPLSALILLLASQALPAHAHHPAGPGGGDLGPSSGMALGSDDPQSFIGMTTSALGSDSRPWGNRVWGLLSAEGGVYFGKGVSLSGSIPMAMSLEDPGVRPIAALSSSSVALHHQALQREHLVLSWGVGQWAPATHEDLGLGKGQLGTALRTALRYKREALSLFASVGSRVEYGQQLRFSMLTELAASGTIRKVVLLGLGVQASPRWQHNTGPKPEWSAAFRPFVGLRLGPRVSLQLSGTVPLIEGGSWAASSGFRTRIGPLDQHSCECAGGVCSCADEH